MIEINNTFKLLEEGEEKIVLSEQFKDVTLVLGNTGSGKSTFIQWIAGDNSKLISKAVGEYTGEFIIEDDNRIGSSMNSKTIFPELVVDRESNSAFYDCPGFSDTRSTSYDIASTYFIKKIVDHARYVKLILTVGYPSVRKGVDRQDFIRLMRHTTDLIKDIKKFENSFAIAITKVDNSAIFTGESYSLVPDTNIIRSIGDFLQTVKEHLELKSQITDISNEEKTFYNNAIGLVTILLTKKNENYTRIGIFRRPNKSGPLSGIPLLQQGKWHVKNILYGNLKFTEKGPNDFGYTISEKSKNDVNILVEKINDKVWLDINEIVKKTQEHFTDLMEKINLRINLFVRNTEIVNVEKEEAIIFSDKLKTGNQVITRLVTESKNITGVAKIIKGSITTLEISTCDDNINNVLEQSRFIAFLQVVSDRNLITRPWSDMFQKIEASLSGSKENLEKNIYEAANKIKDKINNFSERIAKEIEAHYRNKIESLEIDRLLVELEKGVNLMSNLTREINNLRSAKELSKKISDVIINSELSVSSKIREANFSIFYLGKYLEFLYILNNDKLESWSSEWIIPFNASKKYLYESEKWFIFLEDLYTKFADYKIQRDISKYILVENIDDRGIPGESQVVMITKNNFKQFLENIKTHNLKIKEFGFVRDMEVTASRLQTLNNILRVTMSQKIETDCSEPTKLVIKGHYVKLSDFVSTDGKILDLCRNGSNQKTIDIFSLNTLYVDRDILEIGSKLQVSFIAPKWQIVGGRKINLNGASGAPHASKAEKGNNGLPGLPGGAAGNFFGIGGEFFNGEYLSVTANGGDGGSGQQGGDGERGFDGQKATLSRYYGLDVMTINDGRYHGYRFFGQPGGVGRNGGSGGIGGFGGKKGKILILKFDELSSLPSIFNVQGSVGKDGEGGIGGQGGIRGYDLFSSCLPFYINLFENSKCFDLPLPLTKKHSPSGERGYDGGYSKGRKQSSDQSRDFQNITRTVNNYKVYLRNNLEDDFTKSSLLKFVGELGNNMDIRNSYDTLELMNELQDLEKQFHSLHKAVDFMPFYQSLINRTSQYAQSPKNYEKTDSYKKVLCSLYATILSRMATLKESFEPNLIIDLENYIHLVKQNIDSLTKLQEKSNKLNVINQYKNAYKANIDKKIEEVKYFIKYQVSPEIDKINTQVQHKIDLLIRETIALQKQAKIEKEELIQKKKELEDALITSWIFSGLKIIGQVLGCFGPLGAAVGAVIDSTTQVAESLSLSGKDSGTTLQLPDGVIESMQSTIVVLKNQTFARFKRLLENISVEMNKHSEEFSETLSKVKNLITKCHTAQNNSDVSKIKELEKELKQELTRKESTLKNQKDKKKISAIAVVTKINRSIQFGSVGFDIYSKYENDKQKVDAMDEAIKQAEGKIKQLEQYETTIYETITPMLKNMGDDLKNVSRVLNSKSQVFLDVKRWQVQDFLKDIKLQVRKLTKGFTIEDNLARCIEKFEETITTLIHVYGHIQNYQEQQQLAVYIADISSPNANNIGITNETLNNAVNELEVIIRSNLVVEQYKTVVNALKQQVFPFAYHYLEETRLTSLFQSAGNFTDLVSKAVQQVEDIQSKITTYKTAIKLSDSYTNTGWFSRDYVSAQPFFLWKNSHYGDEISKLLSGEKVVLKANILNSPFGKDAIKFKNIAFNFYSENSTLTSEVNNKLKGFTVTATHLGNSYFRYNNNIYVITSDSLNIEFSFEKDAQGEPVHKNSVYDKIKFGDLMLSPYAMWEIQLVKATNKINFPELTLYKDLVNLELVGCGSYLKRGTNISDTDIENYYDVVGTMLIPDLIDDNQQLLPTLTNLSPKESALRLRDHQHRVRRKLPDISSSAQRPTSWITYLWQGTWGILDHHNPRLPLINDTQAASDYNVYHLQGGLQFLDLMIRKWTGKKYAPPPLTLDVVEQQRTADSELAYAAYRPAVKQRLAAAVP